MKNPIDLLYKEHEIITEATVIAKNLRKIINRTELYGQQVFELTTFFREFGDNYHHHKEEQVLFPEMLIANELLKQGVVLEMFENHENFRELIEEIDSFAKSKEYDKAQDKLEQYVDLLNDHIAVENEEVFEIARTLFDNNELDKIYFKFKDIDNELGEDNKISLQKKLDKIQQTIVA